MTKSAGGGKDEAYYSRDNGTPENEANEQITEILSKCIHCQFYQTAAKSAADCGKAEQHVLNVFLT